MARSRALADRSFHDMSCLYTFTRQRFHADGVVAGLQAMGKANSRMHAQRNLSKMPAAVFISCCSGQWFSKLSKTSCGRSSCRAASHGKGKLKNACEKKPIKDASSSDSEIHLMLLRSMVFKTLSIVYQNKRASVSFQYHRLYSRAIDL